MPGTRERFELMAWAGEVDRICSTCGAGAAGARGFCFCCQSRTIVTVSHRLVRSIAAKYGYEPTHFPCRQAIPKRSSLAAPPADEPNLTDEDAHAVILGWLEFGDPTIDLEVE